MSRVVVGIDGSAGSRAALRFAADEARLRGADLHVLHAWRVPVLLGVPGPEIAGFAPLTVDELEEGARRERRAADRVLAETVLEVLGPGDEPATEAVEADAGEALVEASEGADLLVVGSRGRSGLAETLLGSVSRHCAHHARCPVAIVPLPERSA